MPTAFASNTCGHRKDGRLNPVLAFTVISHASAAEPPADGTNRTEQSLDLARLFHI
ncbi:hypothetical protein SAMN05216276_102340 [Streptosporangium subroseum]|uniref:Uncharacterized protein n=2 Tax=Streptosporangium subroseum TaxID=106412 RepID=A0A239JJY3_9ACTN|nr:hypothetical protein SAMN05216276_102340 [Streptosporangium subroseum]